MTAPHNPQAFPTGDHTNGGHDGMTLRDWFAGQALAGMLAAIDPREPGKDAIPVLAEASFSFADAMLAARDAS